MIYVYPISIPPNTNQYSPLVQDLQLSAGKVTQVQIQYPSGVSGLAHVQLAIGLWQIYPTNPDGSFTTSAETIIWDEDFDIDTGSNILRAICWNDDTVNSHTVTVRVVIQSQGDTSQLADQIAALINANAAGG